MATATADIPVNIQSAPGERLTSLQCIATVESVACSTRIEGVTLSDDEVHALLRRDAVSNLASRDEEEVAGYAAAMDLIFESFRELELTKNHIQQLHRVRLGHSSADARCHCLQSDLSQHGQRNRRAQVPMRWRWAVHHECLGPHGRAQQGR